MRLRPSAGLSISDASNSRAVPMPLPVKSRRYDEAFWKELLGSAKAKKDGLKDLGF